MRCQTKSQIFTTLFCWSAIFLLAAAVPGQVAPTTEAFAGSDEQDVKVIRAAYQRLVELTRSTGKLLEFELADFETLAREDLGSVLWIDRITMPGGDMVDVKRSLYTVYSTGDQRIEYKPSWSLSGASYMESAEALEFAVDSLSVEDLLAAVAAEQAEFSNITRMTSYAVTVRLEDHSRSYRAAAFWLGPSRGLRATKESAEGKGAQDLEIRIVDQITQGVEEATVENMPLIDSWEDFKQGNIEAIAASEGINGPMNKSFPTCQVTNQPVLLGWDRSNTTGHFTGKHRTTGTMRTDCSCNSSCLGACQAGPENDTCTDSGFPSTACHARATSETVGLDFSFGGTTQCPAAYTCGVKSCLFCICSFSVSASPLGVGFEFDASAPVLHQFGIHLGNPECPACYQ